MSGGRDVVPHPQTPPQGGASHVTHLVLVPVDGKVVLSVCVLLIAACVLWLLLLLHQGVEHDKER